MNETTEPKLAPPGAGLPKPELFIGRLLFAIRCRTGNRATFDADFSREREAIRKLTVPLDEASAARRVLIERVRGLEDSSRHWSVWMTLEHLRIVNRGITGAIIKLSRGSAPEGVASTAAVKPSAGVTGEVVAAYESSCDDLLATVAAVDDLKTKVRYDHPWFGPLDASQWHAMAGSHMRIHRVQIERIVRGLA
jgi:hypothetical protein